MEARHRIQLYLSTYTTQQATYHVAMTALGVFRGVCARRHILHPSFTLTQVTTISNTIRPAAVRTFNSSRLLRKDDTHIKPVQHESKVDAITPPKPESVQKEKPAEPTKQPALLAEQTVSNKEQRKADWAIIKDMAQYLWPKNDFGTRFRVGLSVALLIGAKVAPVSTIIPINRSRVDHRVGSECASPFLFQIHCRFYEYRFRCCW